MYTSTDLAIGNNVMCHSIGATIANDALIRTLPYESMVNEVGPAIGLPRLLHNQSGASRRALQPISLKCASSSRVSGIHISLGWPSDARACGTCQFVFAFLVSFMLGSPGPCPGAMEARRHCGERWRVDMASRLGPAVGRASWFCC
jgi:hypothetical protein